MLSTSHFSTAKVARRWGYVVTRLILLLIVGIWMAGAASEGAAGDGAWIWPAHIGVPVLLGGYLAMILGLRLWAQRLSSLLDSYQLHSAVKRFNRVVSVARFLVPAWLAFAVLGPIGWATLVHDWLAPIGSVSIQASQSVQHLALALPGVLLGTLPAMLAWLGLWWAQFPADRALREQSMLDQLEQDLPLHAPPTFRRYFLAAFRIQVLFVLLPVLLILLLRDLVMAGISLSGITIDDLAALENWTVLPTAAAIFLIAPEILRRVLHTRPLDPSPLRARLEEICRRRKLRYREILLWDTQNSMCNAAVMGLFAPVRYILLSDLLLETMTDEQIEAVFAHEVGHIAHHHMAWYAVFFAGLTLAMIGPGYYLDTWIMQRLQELHILSIRLSTVHEVLSTLSILALILVVFGYLSRRFERQADVFAARMLQSNWGTDAQPSRAARLAGHVGQYGATLFASALHRVAVVNNIPLAAPSWCHGSMAKRMRYLQTLSIDPTLTRRFDRDMSRLYTAMVVVVACCGFVAMWP